MESKVQKRLIKKLKEKGCYIIKTKPGPGTPVGCLDVFAFHKNWYGVFECKAYEDSEFRPLQPETIQKFSGWTYTRVVHSGNIDFIEKELDLVL